MSTIELEMQQLLALRLPYPRFPCEKSTKGAPQPLICEVADEDLVDGIEAETLYGISDTEVSYRVPTERILENFYSIPIS